MSLLYTLEIVTDLSRQVVAERIRTTLPCALTPAPQRESLILLAPPFRLDIMSASPDWAEIVAENYRFIPTIRLLFTVKPTKEVNCTYFALEVSMNLLRSEPQADAILLHNGELPIFQRVKGVVTVNSDFSLWRSPQAVARWFPEGAEVRSLPMV